MTKTLKPTCAWDLRCGRASYVERWYPGGRDIPAGWRACCARHAEGATPIEIRIPAEPDTTLTTSSSARPRGPRR